MRFLEIYAAPPSADNNYLMDSRLVSSAFIYWLCVIWSRCERCFAGWNAKNAKFIKNIICFWRHFIFMRYFRRCKNANEYAVRNILERERTPFHHFFFLFNSKWCTLMLFICKWITLNAYRAHQREWNTANERKSTRCRAHRLPQSIYTL